jgi:hypothetical protein
VASGSLAAVPKRKPAWLRFRDSTWRGLQAGTPAFGYSPGPGESRDAEGASDDKEDDEHGDTRGPRPLPLPPPLPKRGAGALGLVDRTCAVLSAELAVYWPGPGWSRCAPTRRGVPLGKECAGEVARPLAVTLARAG